MPAASDLPNVVTEGVLQYENEGYFTLLIYSPGRNPPWLEEAEACFEVVVKEIDTYQINLNSMT